MTVVSGHLSVDSCQSPPAVASQAVWEQKVNTLNPHPNGSPPPKVACVSPCGIPRQGATKRVFALVYLVLKSKFRIISRMCSKDAILTKRLKL